MQQERVTEMRVQQRFDTRRQRDTVEREEALEEEEGEKDLEVSKRGVMAMMN